MYGFEYRERDSRYGEREEGGGEERARTARHSFSRFANSSGLVNGTQWKSRCPVSRASAASVFLYHLLRSILVRARENKIGRVLIRAVILLHPELEKWFSVGLRTFMRDFF